LEKLFKQIFSFILGIMLVFSSGLPALANGTSVSNPNIPDLVNGTFFLDTTGTIPQSILDQANQKAREINSKGYQIGGWFFNDTPSTMEQMTTQFGNHNRLGFAGNDNGIAISIAVDRKGKDGKSPAIFIATGKGMGGLLNDAKVGRIKREVFDVTKTGKIEDWQQGFLITIEALTGELNGENKYELVMGTGDWIIIAFFVGFLLLMILVLILGLSNKDSNSGGGGSGKTTSKSKSSTYSSGSSWSDSSSSSWGSSDSSSSSDSSWDSGGGGSFDGGGSGD
jgi:hypothetical protein